MWNTIQCAVQGRGHIKTGTPCQDKVCTKIVGDTQVIALADGAGSAKLSHIGAEYVTKQICESLAYNFELYFGENDGIAVKRKIVSDLLDGLKKVADSNFCDIKDLASTLLVAAVRGDKYIIIHIGDGVIGYLKKDQLKVATCPENGEFVNTTIFVTSKDVLSTMKILKGSLGDISGFALMSDGTETSLYHKQKKALAPVLKSIMKMTTILNCTFLEMEVQESFETVIKNNTTDDCSLVLMVKEDDSFRGYNNLSWKEKAEFILEAKTKKSKKIMHKYDELLNFLSNPKSIAAISRKIYLKDKCAKKHLKYLRDKNFVTKEKNCYRTILILEKQSEQILR